MSRLFALENRIDSGSLDVFLQLHPARIATQEGSKNIHGLTMGMNNRPPTSGSWTHADTEWCFMSLDKGCSIERFKPVEDHHNPPREMDEPVTDKVPDKRTWVEVGWDIGGRGRRESDVEKCSHHPQRQEP